MQLFVDVSKIKCMTPDELKSNLQLAIFGKVMKRVSDFILLGDKLSYKDDGKISFQ